MFISSRRTLSGPAPVREIVLGVEVALGGHEWRPLGPAVAERAEAEEFLKFVAEGHFAFFLGLFA